MNNSTVICTLFEGSYDQGVAALTNSLFKSGFRGEIYIGYKGKLPNWANKSIPNKELKWKNAKTLNLIEGVELHFLPLDTAYHLTNYKPDFMLSLFEGPAKEADGIFYFDPDIVISEKWHFFEKWLEIAQITLCEDINSRLSEFHPRRLAWRNFFEKNGIILVHVTDYYVNGGFVGILKTQIDFLRTWKKIQLLISTEIGGLSNSSLLPINLENKFGVLDCFNKTDQDALNISMHVNNFKISILGKDAMGFNHGHRFMFHALGKPKPWEYNLLINFTKGNSPSECVKEYWKNVIYPIPVYRNIYTKLKVLQILIFSFLSRFYSK